MKLKQEKETSEARWGLLFASPVILGFFLLVLVPVLAALYLSLTDYTIGGTPQFTGLKHYTLFFSGKDLFFYKSLKVTLTFVFMFVPLSLITTFTGAILLNNTIKGNSFFRTVFYLPSVIPVVASSILWLWLLNPQFGLFNYILRSLKLPQSQWLWDEATVIPSIVLMSLWTAGNTMIIFLAGLQNISTELYEAVELDGGRFFHKFRHITLPMVSTTLFFNLVMGFIGGFQVFTKALVMTEGGPNNGSLFLVYLLYREAFRNLSMGRASAIAWILFTIIALLTLLIFKTSNRWVYSEGSDR